MPISTPAQDTVIARSYDAKSLQEKLLNKAALQKELGWPAEPKQAVLCLPCGMSEELGGELLKEILPGLFSQPLQILVRGKGDSSYGEYFSKLAEKYGHRIAILPNDEASMRKMFAASDMALFLTDATKMPELQHCLDYGVIPLAPVSPKLENYDPNQERGTGFLFEKATVWHCFAAIVRALETYRFPYDWRTIQRQCMENA